MNEPKENEKMLPKTKRKTLVSQNWEFLMQKTKLKYEECYQNGWHNLTLCL